MIYKKVILGYIIISFLIGFNTKVVDAQPQETLTISAKELIERLTRIEENQKALQRQIEENQKNLQQQIGNLQQQIDNNQKSLQRQIDELKNFTLWGFGIMSTGMFAWFGFVLWDRRTALQPTVNEVKELRQKEEMMEKIFREYARKDIKFAGVMRAAGLL